MNESPQASGATWPQAADPPRVCICVVTYRRVEPLRRLLDQLGQLRFTTIAPRVEIQVVDNDAGASARPVCSNMPAGFPWPVHYAIEPRPGIAVARNRALALAKERADYIAFIDDDEVPQPEWLDELLAAQRKSGAAVVAGPVRPRYLEGVPHWVVKGRFHQRPQFPDGGLLRYAATGNVLLRTRILDEMDTFFDERLALSGGEDKEFFLRVGSAGFAIVWAERAVAHEDVPASRTSVRWILQRAFRYGNTGTIIQRYRGDSPAALGRQFAVGWYRIAKGCLLFAPSLLVGRHAAVRCARHVAYGLGILSGFSGRLYAEYGKTRASGRRGAR